MSTYRGGLDTQAVKKKLGREVWGSDVARVSVAGLSVRGARLVARNVCQSGADRRGMAIRARKHIDANGGKSN